jgi:hypothetical protein
MNNIKEIAHYLTPGREVTGRMVNGRFEYVALDGIPVAYARGERPFAIGVRAVLAGAYRGNGGRRGGMGQREGRAMLTHAVACNVAGEEIRVLCAGVKLESLCDVAESGPPTCPTCARRAAK